MGTKTSTLRSTKEFEKMILPKANFLQAVEGQDDVLIMFSNCQRKGVTIFAATEDKVWQIFACNTPFTHSLLSPDGRNLILTDGKVVSVFDLTNASNPISATLDSEIKTAHWISNDTAALATKNGIFTIDINGTLQEILAYESYEELLNFKNCSKIIADSTKRLWMLSGFQWVNNRNGRYRPIAVFYDSESRSLITFPGCFFGVFKSFVRDQETCQFLFLCQDECGQQKVRVFSVGNNCKLVLEQGFAIQSGNEEEEHITDLRISETGLIYIISSNCHVTVVNPTKGCVLLEFGTDRLITKSLIPVNDGEEGFYCLSIVSKQGQTLKLSDLLKYCHIEEGVTPYLHLDLHPKLPLPNLRYLKEQDPLLYAFGDKSWMEVSNRDPTDSPVANLASSSSSAVLPYAPHLPLVGDLQPNTSTPRSTHDSGSASSARGGAS